MFFNFKNHYKLQKQRFEWRKRTPKIHIFFLSLLITTLSLNTKGKKAIYHFDPKLFLIKRKASTFYLTEKKEIVAHS